MKRPTAAAVAAVAVGAAAEVVEGWAMAAVLEGLGAQVAVATGCASLPMLCSVGAVESVVERVVVPGAVRGVREVVLRAGVVKGEARALVRARTSR